MKSKASLALIECCIMLLVLALASALCLKSFLWADIRSRENSLRDTALCQMQSAAETLKAYGSYEAAAKHYGGTWDGRLWHISGEDYHIQVTPVSANRELLSGALVEAVYQQQVILSFRVYWQEVAE